MRIGLLSFGGPAGQIAVMHRILVDEKRWIGEERFLHALSYCMLLPGPEAQQLATYIGWLLHGTRGGLVAGLLFVLPGFISIMALSVAYVLWQQQPIVEGLFLGLKAAVIALVIEALIRIGKRALTSRAALWVAALAFVAIAVLHAPFPLIVLGAGLAGLPSRPLRLGIICSPARKARGRRPRRLRSSTPASSPRRNLPRAAPSNYSPCGCRYGSLPCSLCAWWLGASSTYTQLGVFFSKMAVVTFGGAYAVLTYVAQQAVERFAWVTPAQMLDGLGLAESTPGPLIMVVQFVGFLAAYQVAARRPSVALGSAGRPPHRLGHVRAVFPVDLPRRALHRGAARQRCARERARCHHRRGGRCDRQSRVVVCHARAVRPSRSASACPTCHRCAWCRPC